MLLGFFFEKLIIFFPYRFSLPVDVACFLISCFGVCRSLNCLCWKKGHFSSYFPFFFLLLFIDGQPRDSKSGLIDTSLFTKDSPKEWSQTHLEWCHSQRCVWGPCQQVHPAPPGSCSWGQSQQVQVSRTDSREGSKDELSFHGTEWAQRGNRKSIHMTETWRKMNDPLYNLKN